MNKEERFKFKVGEIVRIKEKNRILSLVDELYQLDGYLFMEQMWNYCEKKYKIIKLVKNVFDEKGVKIYKVKAPAYILKDIICDGEIDHEDFICDHSCYFLWHEKWLQEI